MTGDTNGHGDGQEDAEVEEFCARWAKAELRGDAEELSALLADDFRGVGPRGFVLDRDKWLERYRSDILIHDSFTWQDVEVRRYGSTAVAIGIQGQQSISNGLDADGLFRATQILRRRGDDWTLVSIHLSPITVPPST